MPAPVLDDERRTRLGRWKMFAVLAVCAAPVIASYLTYFVIRPQGRTNYSELIVPTRGLPDASFTDLAGRPVAADALKGQWLLVVVAGGACDVACERMLFMQRQLREMVGAEKDRIDKVWLVSDAAPLRPELRRALEAAPATTVLRAPPKVLAGWLAPAEGHGLADHLYIVDPMGQWMMRTPAEPDPSRIKRDLDKLLRASSAWDLPGR